MKPPMWHVRWLACRLRLCFVAASFVAEPLQLLKPLVSDSFGDGDTIGYSGGYSGRFIPLARFFETRFANRIFANRTFANRSGEDALLYGSPLENHHCLLQTLEKKLLVLGNSASTLKALARLNAFSQAVNAGGGNTPKITTSGVRVVKINGKSGGMGTQYAKGNKPAQELIKGDVVGFNFFAAQGRILPLVISKMRLAPTKATPFRLGGFSTEPTFPPYLAELLRLARNLARRFNLIGINNLDVVITNNHKVYALELNPRIGSSLRLLPVYARKEALEWHIQCCRKQILPPPSVALRLQRQATGAVAFLYNRTTRAMPPLAKQKWISDLPLAGSLLKKYEPFCSVFAPTETLLAKRVASITKAARL